jgi:hypothetical protein
MGDNHRDEPNDARAKHGESKSIDSGPHDGAKTTTRSTIPTRRTPSPSRAIRLLLYTIRC